MPIPGEMLRRGWGVVRLTPWHLAGIFVSSAEAEDLAETLGPDYAVKFGDHLPGSGEFSVSEPQSSNS